jgi:Flp pilus assembly protein TadD
MTADHGEGRLEHDEMTHAFLAYDTTLHVPLIVRVPGRAGGVRTSERVGTVDVVPTVLDLLGFDLPGHLQGRSLQPVMDGASGGRGPSTATRRDYYSESMSPRLSHGFGELRVLFRGPYKYLHGPRPELFHLEDDPQELRDLSAEMPQETEQLERALQAFVESAASAGASDAVHQASEATRRQLEALGYLSTTGESPEAVVERLRSDGEAPQYRVGDINLVSRLRNQLGQGQYGLARQTAEQLLEAAPEHAFYRAKLVAANVGHGRIEEAARVVEETESVTAANVEDFLEVARALFNDGQRERGLRMARRLVDGEESPHGRLLLARLEREAGNDDAFELELARTLELDPESLEARLERAEYLTETRAFDDADHELRELLQAYPVFAAGHLAYGRLLARSGNREEAVARLGRAITLAPGLCEAHLERLELLVELGRPQSVEEALAAMRRDCRDRESLARAADAIHRGEAG